MNKYENVAGVKSYTLKKTGYRVVIVNMNGSNIVRQVWTDEARYYIKLNNELRDNLLRQVLARMATYQLTRQATQLQRRNEYE